MSQWLRLTPGGRGVHPDATRQTTTNVANRHDGQRRGWSRGGRRCGWSSAAANANLTLMSLQAAYYFYKN